jgi:hypothetical protein
MRSSPAFSILKLGANRVAELAGVSKQPITTGVRPPYRLSVQPQPTHDHTSTRGGVRHKTRHKILVRRATTRRRICQGENRKSPGAPAIALAGYSTRCQRRRRDFTDNHRYPKSPHPPPDSRSPRAISSGDPLGVLTGESRPSPAWPGACSYACYQTYAGRRSDAREAPSDPPQITRSASGHLRRFHCSFHCFR